MLFSGREPVFKDGEHKFLGVEHRFHAQEQKDALRAFDYFSTLL